MTGRSSKKNGNQPVTIGLHGMRWLAVGVLGTLVAIGTAAVVNFVRDRVDPGTPPLSVQLEQILRSAAEQGFQLTNSRIVDLKGIGVGSRDMVFSASNDLGDQYDKPAGADYIRIYDNDSGHLHLRFSFQPTSQARFSYTDKSGHRHHLLVKWPYTVRILGVRDLNGAGERAIFVGCQQRFADWAPVRPIMIYWDPSQGDYLMQPIISKPSQLTTSDRYTTPLLGRYLHRGDWAARARKFYLSPVRLHDYRNPDLAVTSLAAESAQIAPTKRTVVLTSFRVSGVANASLSRDQVIGWSIDTFSGKPQAHTCSAFAKNRAVPMVILPRPYQGIFATRTAWRRYSKRLQC